MGDRWVVSPIICKAHRGLALRHSIGAKPKAAPDTMGRSGAAREKTWEGSGREVGPLRSFTSIDLPSKRAVTRPNAKGRGPVGPRPD